MLSATKENDPADPSKAMLNEAYELFTRSFDHNFGGFGSPPKFPSPHNLLFLLRYCQYEKQSNALLMVEKTLDAMARGGIFDHIGGGFSRYSTDRRWLVPHFEKMLYDNALLILAYTEAYQITKNRRYSDVIRRTADYILRELTSPKGAFTAVRMPTATVWRANTTPSPLMKSPRCLAKKRVKNSALCTG